MKQADPLQIMVGGRSTPTSFVKLSSFRREEFIFLLDTLELNDKDRIRVGILISLMCEISILLVSSRV